MVKLIPVGTLVADESGRQGVVVARPEFMRQAFGEGDVLVAWINYTTVNIVDSQKLESRGLIGQKSQSPE